MAAPISPDEALKQLYQGYDPATKTANWVCTKSQQQANREGWPCSPKFAKVEGSALAVASINKHEVAVTRGAANGTEGNPADTIPKAKPPGGERPMPPSRQLTITLPAELAEMVERKVASGEYADESAVLVDSLALLQDHQQKTQRWLREDVVPACTAFEENPSSSMSSSELLAHLDAARRDRQRSA